MKYFLIDKNGIITNTIECDEPVVAESLNAVEFNSNLDIGDKYVSPEPEHPLTLETRVTELEVALAQTDETAIELFEAQAIQEEINAAQDEALIELYEKLEV